MTPTGVARLSPGQSGLDRLRKSLSYEPLAPHQEGSSSSTGDEAVNEEFSGGDRQNSRLHSASMSHLKSSLCHEEGGPSATRDLSRVAAFQMSSMADDDVFTENPARSARRSVRASNMGSSIPRHDGREVAKFLDEPVSVDAQGIYPPSACIFVANLTQAESDDALEAEVTRVFSEFGTVFVKIRRDQRNMPFAFCQFTNDEDAKDAVTYSHGTIILGRPCRVEKAKANSTFIVYKHSGLPTDETEVLQLLEPLGEISSVECLDTGVQAEMGLPPTMVVQFKLYDPRRDVRKATRRDQRFVVKEYEPNLPSPETRRQAELRAEEMAEYDRDRRSAYLGNLPLDMTELEMKQIAVSFGSLRNLRLYHKMYKGGPVEICFAFIEFTRPDSVDEIIKAYHGHEFRGHTIKVERKLSRSFNGNQERDLKASVKAPDYSESSTPWRAPGLPFLGSSQQQGSPHRVSDSPSERPSNTSFGSPAGGSISRSATMSYQLSHGKRLASPSTHGGFTAGTPSRASRAVYTPSVWSPLRSRGPARPHVRDIFDSPRKHSHGESWAPDENNGSNYNMVDLDSDDTGLVDNKNHIHTNPGTPARSFTTAASVSTMHTDVYRNRLAKGEEIRPNGESPNEISYRAKIVQRDAKTEQSPSEDDRDDEEGGAPFSPAPMASAVPSATSPDASGRHAVPYYHYPQLGSFHVQAMPHTMAPLTPFSHPHVVHGGHMAMPYISTPAPFPHFYNSMMFPHLAMSNAFSYEPGQSTPARSIHHHLDLGDHEGGRPEVTPQDGLRHTCHDFDRNGQAPNEVTNAFPPDEQTRDETKTVAVSNNERARHYEN